MRYIDEIEEKLITQLEEHEAFKNIETMEDQKFLDILNQKFLVYDMVIDGLNDNMSKKIVKKIQS